MQPPRRRREYHLPPGGFLLCTIIWQHHQRTEIWHAEFILARAGPWRRTRRVGGGVFEHPKSALVGHVATHGKRHSKGRQKSWRIYFVHFFKLGQWSGNQRSPKVKFCRFQHSFSTNRHITRDPEELQRRGKRHSIALLTLFRTGSLKFDLRSVVWSPESRNSKNNFLSASNFCCRGAPNEQLSFDLKKSFWKFDVVKVVTWPEKDRVAYQWIRIVRLNTTMVFSSLAGLYQKLLPKNCWWPSSPEMTFATWWGVTGRNIPNQGVKFICNPMIGSSSNGFRPKEAPFIFLPLTYNGEITKLTWPWVTDIKIPRFLDTATDINCWKFQGDRSLGYPWRAFKLVLRWGHLTWPGDLTLSDLSEVFTTCAEKMYEQVCQKPERVWTPPGTARASKASSDMVNC